MPATLTTVIEDTNRYLKQYPTMPQQVTRPQVMQKHSDILPLQAPGKQAVSMQPCVGVELIYTPITNSCLEGLGRELHKKVINNLSNSDLAFDVTKLLVPGEEILVFVANPTHSTEVMLGRVKWTRPMAEGHFRIGVAIDTVYGVMPDKIVVDGTVIIAEPIGLNHDIPVEVAHTCPACNTPTTFTFVANQSGRWEQGILPLYNCGACGTTRTLLSLLVD